jgi:hypothetical protein
MKLSDFAFLLAGWRRRRRTRPRRLPRRGHCPLHAPAAGHRRARRHRTRRPAAAILRRAKLYTAARADILQVRVLLKSGRTQSSVGSGFLIGTSNLVVTNYHVVSQFALDPDTYVGEWVDTGGQRQCGTAGRRRAARPGRAAREPPRHGLFQDAGTAGALTQGQYLYSMGNPLDLGFAISKGVQRRRHAQLL